jgi:hypothetical protein
MANPPGGNGGPPYPQGGAYPQQQPGYPQQPGGYPQQPGYAQPGVYPQQPGAYPYPPQGYVQQQGGYPMPGGPYAPPGMAPMAPMPGYPMQMAAPSRQHERARLALILAAASWFTGLSLLLAIPAWVIAAGARREIAAAPPGTYSNASEGNIAFWVAAAHVILFGLIIVGAFCFGVLAFVVGAAR